MSAPAVLLICDEPLFSVMLQSELAAAGFAITCAPTLPPDLLPALLPAGLPAASAACAKSAVPLILLDLDCPAGRTAHDALTAPSSPPCPLLTFSKNVFAGADLVRPFSIPFFLSLVAERLSLAGGLSPDSAPPAQTLPALSTASARPLLRYEPAENKKSVGALWVNGYAVPLSRAEDRLFALLYAHRGSPVALDALRAALGSTGGKASDPVPVHISHLRKKLDGQFGCRMLLAVRGRGYMLL